MLKGLHKARRSGIARLSDIASAWCAPPGARVTRFMRRLLRGRRLFPPRHFQHNVKVGGKALLLAILLSASAPGNALAAPPGAVISNQGYVEFQNSSGLDQTFSSNVVDVVTVAAPTTSSLEVTRVVAAGQGLYQETVGPSACFQGGSFAGLGNPTLIGGNVIDPSTVHAVDTTGSYNLGEPVFVRLNDMDQNQDYLAVEYAVVNISHAGSGDSETIQLTETGPDTGVFAGFVPTSAGTAASGDCMLQGGMNSTLSVDYVDPVDANDTSNASATFDPVGIVFESRTGTVVDGAILELVDATTGSPAMIYGNDGVSTFPSIITSGGTEVDSSGNNYTFGPGEYRFPVVADGDYRLLVSPPTDYVAPSTESISDLQNLPGAPYALGPGSFGNSFTQSGSVSFNLDIPVDPQSTALFLQKTTLTTIAAPGDFVRYDLVIENSSVTGMATDVEVIDQMPLGVRFVPGSVTRDGNQVTDPVVDMNNATLTFDVGDMATAETARIAYVVEIISGEANTDITNTATAFAGNGLISNNSSATIRLTEDMFRSTSTIIGRVLEGDCTDPTFHRRSGCRRCAHLPRRWEIRRFR